MCPGQGAYGKSLYHSSQFCCEPGTAFKNYFFFFFKQTSIHFMVEAVRHPQILRMKTPPS